MKTREFNKAIEGSAYPVVYKNGKGVLVRNPFDGFEQDSNKKVVPSTLWVNDIFSPSQLYTGYGGGNGNPWCPTSATSCPRGSTGDTGPFNSIQMGYVIHGAMSQLWTDWDKVQDGSWGNGVFYASDSNSADLRCGYFKTAQYEGYDCPGGWYGMDGSWSPDSSKHGAGFYEGQGCHFNHVDGIDQTNAKDSTGRNLMGNYNCECEYAFKGAWEDWVDQWREQSYLSGSGGKGPTWAADLAACWFNNPTDMINLQNQLWWKRRDWNDQKVPRVSYKEHDAAANREYWGWNEVPAKRSVVTNQQNWDAVLIKLPAGACGGDGKNDFLSCIPYKYQEELENQLDMWHKAGYLDHEIVIAREYMDTNTNYLRQFFCEAWQSPSGRYNIYYGGDHCTIQRNSDNNDDDVVV